ncbi:hypothetical protein GBAR_LOCUS31069 [Geodia barretti]|uniref:B30.2/SPRY domain-containing protein n=1 Tax=Geodia barretti TaxID=519541 RepID=A0AA35TZB9_GEOBA|nr:hypothetical protein GBAR_LOCUS31069 [Geodia barretti]
MLDLSQHIMSFYRNGKLLGIIFDDVHGPVVPAVSFCRHKALTLRFPSTPPTSPAPPDISRAPPSPGMSLRALQRRDVIPWSARLPALCPLMPLR